MAKRHKRGHVKGEPNNPICVCGQTYFNCGSNCECCDNVTTTGGGELINPASTFGYGFDTSYDGRVRGGIKTPNMPTMPIFEAFKHIKKIDPPLFILN